MDYLWGLLLISSPFAFGFQTGGWLSWLAWGFGAGAILYSLVTAYELGIVPLIPVPLHLGLDALAGAALCLLAFGLSATARETAVVAVFGLVSLAAALVTRTAPAHS